LIDVLLSNKQKEPEEKGREGRPMTWRWWIEFCASHRWRVRPWSHVLKISRMCEDCCRGKCEV
jgi:hypothetical protein